MVLLLFTRIFGLQEGEVMRSFFLLLLSVFFVLGCGEETQWSGNDIVSTGITRQDIKNATNLKGSLPKVVISVNEDIPARSLLKSIQILIPANLEKEDIDSILRIDFYGLSIYNEPEEIPLMNNEYVASEDIHKEIYRSYYGPVTLIRIEFNKKFPDVPSYRDWKAYNGIYKVSLIKEKLLAEYWTHQVFGDLNGDGIVDNFDRLEVNKCFGQDPRSSKICNQSDVDFDGYITPSDRGSIAANMRHHDLKGEYAGLKENTTIVVPNR